MLDNLNEYFDKFIKQYHPYEDDEFYQILIKYIQENFLVDSYNVIPDKLKTLFEEHTLIPDIYDIILESLGYAKELLNDLTFNQKKLILTHFSNYQSDKGDLRSCKSICKIFNEPVSLYELWIDYRTSTNLYNWYFIPKPISLTENIDVDSILPLDYDEVYNSVPSYFVNKGSLINAYTTKSIKLPLKSNLLLLEVASITATDELTNLTIATVLTHFKNLEIPVTVNGTVFGITIMGFYQLWQYLLLLFYGKIETVDTLKPIILYDLSIDDFHYTLDVDKPNNLQSVITEYESLQTSIEITEFYVTKFKSVFLEYVTPQIITIDTIKRNLAFEIDLDLLQYVSDQVGEAHGIDTVAPVLSALRNSFINYCANVNEDVLFAEYSSVLLNVFELALINPLNTATYKLIDSFKPYHTQLISKFKYGVKYESKFTNALMRLTVAYTVRHYNQSACVISTDTWFNEKLIGECQVVNGTEIVVDDEIANQYNEPWVNKIYWAIPGYRYPSYLAVLVIAKNQVGDHWVLTLESEYTGETGTFDYCFKRYQ